MAAAALLESYAGLPLCIGAVFGAQVIAAMAFSLHCTIAAQLMAHVTPPSHCAAARSDG